MYTGHNNNQQVWQTAVDRWCGDCKGGVAAGQDGKGQVWGNRYNKYAVGEPTTISTSTGDDGLAERRVFLMKGSR